MPGHGNDRRNEWRCRCGADLTRFVAPNAPARWKCPTGRVEWVDADQASLPLAFGSNPERPGDDAG